MYTIKDVQYKQDLLVNPDEIQNAERYGYKGFILSAPSGNFSLTMAIILAKHLEEALDIAADEDKLNHLKVDVEEEDLDTHTALGNSGDYYDLQNLHVEEFAINISLG